MTELEKKNSELSEKLGAAEGRAAELDRSVVDMKRRRQELNDSMSEMVRLIDSARTLTKDE